MRRPFDMAGMGGLLAADLAGVGALMLLALFTLAMILTKKADGFRMFPGRRLSNSLAASSC